MWTPTALVTEQVAWRFTEQEWLHKFPRLFTDTYEHIHFFSFSFLHVFSFWFRAVD